MAKPLERSPWILPVLLGLMVVLVSALTLVSKGDRQTEVLTDRSVYNSGPSGYRAWYLSMEKTGVPVQTWQKPFQELDAMPPSATMLIVEPYTLGRANVLFGSDAVNLLLRWVRRGNTLILLDDFKRHGSAALRKRLSLEMVGNGRPANGEIQSLRVVSRGEWLSAYAREPLITGEPARFAPLPEGREMEVLLADELDRPALIRIRHGAGSLVLGTVPDLGGNRFLFEPDNDNYQFLANLLVREKKPVFINEFVHGYTDISDIFAYYRHKTPLGVLFVQFLFLFLFVLWLSFVPWKPRPAEVSDRLARRDAGLDALIESLGGTYYRMGASAMILAPQLNRIDTLLRQRYRIAPDESVRLRHLLTTLVADYSDRDEPADGLPEALAGALAKAREVVQTGQRLPHGELLALARRLTVIQERLQHGKR